MFSNITNAILNSDIVPAVNSTFWSGLGNIFVFIGSWLLQGLATLIYTICKFALNLIDFMQFLVQKLAGIDMWMNLEKLDLSNLKETDVVFRFLLSDTVLDVFRTMFIVFIVLLIVFTIVAILKNEYGTAASGGEKVTDHKKVWFTAAKAIVTVILVPFLLIVGILSSNAILASLAKAFNINGNMSLGGQIFVASAYDASSYRYYASQGVRKYTSNTVNFKFGTTEYKVNAALPDLDPDALKDSNPFSGFMFTYNGKDFYLWQCDASESEAYYYYIKGVLGAYIVENEPERDNDFLEKIEKYNQTFVATDAARDKARQYFSELRGLTSDCETNGFFTMPLELAKGSSIVIDAAYNSWSYNQILLTNISSWGSQNLTLETHVDTFQTLGGTSREAKVVTNSDSWGKIHDGGKYGFSPLAVEYEVMADVIDFILENNVTLYYVNASNTNINYQAGGLDSFTRYTKEDDTGLLIDYKDEGRVAYEIKQGVNSELDGATYIVCYYDNETNQYIPLVNNQFVVDASGNRYKFKSSQFNSDYKGAVIARAMFKSSNQARNCEPTYITTTMVVDQKGTDFDSKLATAVHLDYVGDYTYTYLSKLTDAKAEDTYLGVSYKVGDMFIDEGVLTYYMEPEAGMVGNKENSFTSLLPIDLTIEAGDPPVLTPTKMGTIANNIRDYIVNNIVDENEHTYSYVEGTLHVSADYVISFKIARSGNTDPQHHTISLKVKEESLVDIANGEQLCKVDFETSISLQGSEQKIKLKEKALVEALIENNYMYTADAGKTVYLYLTEIDDTVSPEILTDETFYGIDGVYNNNVNMLVEQVLAMFRDENDAGLTYSYDDINTTIHGPEKNVVMSVYKRATGDPGYQNTKKYDVVIQFVEVSSVTVGEASYRLHKFNVDITEMNENPELVEYADNIDRGVTTNNGVYNRDGYIYYFGTAESMLSTKVKDTSKVIAQGITNLVNTEEDYTASLIYSSVSYTGAVEFGVNYVGNLNIKFTVKIKEDATDNYYVAHFNLSIKALQNTGDQIQVGDPPESVNKYEYVFNYNYTIYNTYKAYMDNLDLTNPIMSLEETPTELIFSIVDLKREDKTARYLVDENTYQTVIQYTYKQVSNEQSITYTFNAVHTGVDCDDGVEFITVSKPDTVAVLDNIGEKAADYNESKLVFKMGTLRTINMPEYSFIKEAGANYIYYIIDTKNTTPDAVHFYSVEFAKDAKNLNIVKTYGQDGTPSYEVGEGTTIKAYTYNGSNYAENADMLSTAIGYIYDHFNVSLYYIDMHGYQEISERTVEEGKVRYTVILNSNTGNTIALTSTDIYLEAETEDVLYSNFNKFLLQAEIDTVRYSRFISADSALENTLAKLIQQPVSVVFCRDQMSNMHWIFDFKINIWTSGEGFDFLWRGPKIGFATIQKNADYSDNVVLTLSRGQVNLDYNFTGNIEMGNIYLVTDLNWIILIFAIVLIFSILGKAVWGLISRIYQITLLFLMMPAVASTMPLDEKGSRFASWKNKIIGQVLGAYGVTIGLNFFFILIPVIREASAIFTDADLVGMNSTLKFFAGSADRLNYLCYILFLLVAFTLLKTVPSLVQEFTGFKDSDVIKQGEDTKKSVVSTVEEAGKSLSGKGVIDGVKNVGNLAKPFLTPGSAFVGEGKKIYDKLRGKKDDKKKAEEEARNQQNQQLAKQNVQNKMEEAKRKMNGELSEEEQMEAVRKENERIMEANKNRGENEEEKPLFSEDAAGYQAMMEAKAAEEAKTAEGLTEEGQKEVAEAVANKQGAEAEQFANDAKRFAEVSEMYAEAAQESAGIATGDVKDYVSEAEAAEKAAKEEEKARRKQERDEQREQRKYEKSTEGQLAIAEQLAADGKAKAARRLSKTDIENWNKTHGADEQITGENTKEQKELRLRARQEKYLNDLRNKLDDERNGIKHGIGASIFRTIIGGKKTWQQRVEEAAELERSKENLDKANSEKTKTEEALSGIKINNIMSDGEADKIFEKMAALPNGKKASEAYFKYMEEQAKNGRSGLAVRQEALEIMKKESLKIADQNVAKATKKYNKAEANVAETNKGWLYRGGQVALKGLNIAAAPVVAAAKFVADKGRTFLFGHSEKDKNAARTLLAERATYAKETEKAKKAYEAELAEIDKNGIKGQYKKFMDEYNKLKASGGDQSKIYELLKANKDLLKGSGFALEGLEDNITDSRKKTATPRVALRFEQFLNNSGAGNDISKLYAHRQKDLEKERDTEKSRAYQKALQEQSNYEQRNRKAIKKAEQMLNGSHIRSIGVVGNVRKAASATAKFFADGGAYVYNKVKNSKPVQSIMSGMNQLKDYVKDVARDIKIRAMATAESIKESKFVKTMGTVFTKVKDTTVNIARGVAHKAVWAYNHSVGYVVRGVKAVKKWNQDRKEIKANASAKTAQNIESSNESRKAINKSVNRILGQTLYRKKKEADAALVQKMEERLAKLKDKGNVLKAIELEKALKEYKKNPRSKDAQNELLKFATMNVVTRMNRQNARDNLSTMSKRTTREQEQRAKVEYRKLLQKELTKVKLEQKAIDSIVKRVREETLTPSQVYKMAKQELEKAIKDKQNLIMAKRGLGGSSNTRELMNEIKQLKSLVTKLKSTDATYKTSLRKLQEANRKMTKQLKKSKSSGALEESMKFAQKVNKNNN